LLKSSDAKKSQILRKRQEKLYPFYRIADIDFEAALSSLKIIKRYKRLDVRYALLRDIVVSYARPFVECKSLNGDKHRLEIKKFVPKVSRVLHDELIRLRHELFAHTSLIYRNPRFVDWSRNGRKWFPMSFRAYDYQNLNRRLEDIFKLISSARRNLQKEIGLIEEDL